MPVSRLAEGGRIMGLLYGPPSAASMIKGGFFKPSLAEMMQ